MKKVMETRKNKCKIIMTLMLAAVFMFGSISVVQAEPVPIPNIDLKIQQTDNPEEVVDSIKLLVLLTTLSFVPAILLMMTSFTRVIIVLSFIRNAIGTQQIPPNQVLIGLALFLTLFIMTPVYNDVNQQAITPYLNDEINQEQAIEKATKPVKKFLLKHIRDKDLALFVKAAKVDKPQNENELPLTVVIPAFVISELKTAFQMGFLIYIPFLVIDMVVASTLMSMGMFMLPPIMISLPFKVLLFVMVDGWHLIIKSLLESFGL